MFARRFNVLAGVVAVAALSLSACGSSDSSSSSDGASSDSAGIAEAQAFLDSYSGNPTGLGWDTPVSKKIPTGKNIVALETPVAVAKLTNDYRERAMKLLGWNMTRIIVGGGPEDPAKAMQQALDQKPDAIFYAGYDPNSMSAQLADAKAQGIPVIAESVPTKNPAIVGDIRNETTNERLGKMTASFVVADSKGKANVEFFNVPTQPIIVSYQAAFKKYLAEWCPDCKVNVNDFEFSDIGSNLPGQIVSALQRNPKANYVVMGLGDAIVGVDAALQSAGLADQAKIGGAIPSLANYEALKKGDPGFWAVDNAPFISFRQTDMMARAFVGDDLTKVNESLAPAMVLTSKNINDTVFDEDGYWLGYADWENAYKKMWGLS
ncbi:hypothetical protein BH09ACT10_BH09ACT10_08550 [soil metagenome]